MKTDLVAAEGTAIIPRGPLDSAAWWMLGGWLLPFAGHRHRAPISAKWPEGRLIRRATPGIRGLKTAGPLSAPQPHDPGSLREQVLAAQDTAQGVSALSWRIHGGSSPRAERVKGRRTVPVLGANGRFSFYSPAQVRARQVAGRIYIGPRGGWVTAPVYRLAVKAAKRGGGKLRLRKTQSTPASSKGRRK